MVSRSSPADQHESATRNTAPNPIRPWNVQHATDRLQRAKLDVQHATGFGTKGLVNDAHLLVYVGFTPSISRTPCGMVRAVSHAAWCVRRRSMDALFAAFGSDESAALALDGLYLAKVAELKVRLRQARSHGTSSTR